MHIFCGLRAWYNILSVIYCIGKKGKRKEKLKKMLEKVRILLTEENREAAKQAERLAGRLRAEGLEAEEIRISGEKAEGSGTPGDRPGEILPAEQAEGELWITDCPEAARRLAGENCRILLYLTEKSRALPLGEYPYAVESLEGIGAEELEGIWRRLTGEPWEILHTERLIVREQREEDLDSLYEIYAHPDMTAYMEGLSADRQEERERLTSYIRTVYPLYGFGLWMLEKREPEKGEKGGRPEQGGGMASDGQPEQGGEMASDGQPELAGECIGRAGFFWREEAAVPELGFAIRKTEQKKGYCLEACRAILKYGFEELDFSEVQALTRPGNRAAEAVLARLGFQRAGITEADGAPAARWLLRRNR